MNAVRRSGPWLLTVVPAVVVVGLFAPNAMGWEAKSLLAVFAAAAAAGTRLGYRALVAHLGAPTAWAGVSVAWALLFAGVFALSPDCHTTFAPHPCSPQETAVWAAVGGLLPALALVFAVLPYRFAALVYRTVRSVAQPRSDVSEPSPQQNGRARRGSRSGNPAVRAAARKD